MNEPTDVTPPPMPTTPPKVPSLRKPFLLGVATGTLVAALAAGGVFLSLENKEQTPAATADANAPAEASDVAEEPTEEPEPEEMYNDVPLAKEFTVSLKTTEKQCFGSAGCNVTLEPELSYTGALTLNPGKIYSITFEVHGGQDGAVIQTMELSNQDSVSYHPVNLSTSKSGAELTAKVTDVEISE